MKTICVVGLGYIGLPTASMFAVRGKQVIGVDINPRVLEILCTGNLHIEEPGLDTVVRQAMSSGNLIVQGKPSHADAFIIAVPTPITAAKTADMAAVMAATKSIVPFLRPGNLVVLESTSPPRTTLDLVLPILETSGLVAGRDFKLAYSPERVLPGQILRELVSNARVVGGIDPVSAESCRDLYASFVEGEIVLTDATTAEMVKLMENTYRDVNIALANEFALIAGHVGVNAYEAIDIANLHPRVKILRPGPGVGGHCIAVDPWFLVETAPVAAQVITQARAVNDQMPHHVSKLIKDAVAAIQNPIIACFGLTYKADVDDIRESPSLEIVHLLQQGGFNLRICDPHVDTLPGSDLPMLTIEQALHGADCMVLLTDHSEFRTIDAKCISSMRHQVVIDTRNAVSALRTIPSITYYGVGMQVQQ